MHFSFSYFRLICLFSHFWQYLSRIWLRLKILFRILVDCNYQIWYYNCMGATSAVGGLPFAKIIHFENFLYLGVIHLWKMKRKEIKMLGIVVGIVGTVVTVISIVVTVFSIRQSTTKDKHQKSNRPHQE